MASRPYGWAEPAAQRLRFSLTSATGPACASELVGAMLRDMCLDERGDHWLHLIGKGDKPDKVALPPLAIDSSDACQSRQERACSA
jgi:hypothetical protein